MTSPSVWYSAKNHSSPRLSMATTMCGLPSMKPSLTICAPSGHLESGAPAASASARTSLMKISTSSPWTVPLGVRPA
jgi:hypothetical protein